MKNLLFLFILFLGICAYAEVKHFDKLSVIDDPMVKEKCRKNWNNHCQDLVMEYFFGKDWREFKKVTLEFQDAVCNNDIEKAYRLCSMDLILARVSDVKNNQYHFRLFLNGVIENYQAFKEKFTAITLGWDEDAKNLMCEQKYKNFNFYINYNIDLYPILWISEKYGISLNALDNERETQNKNIYIIDEIIFLNY